MAKRTSKQPAAPAIDRAHIVESIERADEYVRILGDAGTALAGIFRIRCHAVNHRTGAEWLELVEVGGTRQFRAVRPENTRPARKAELRNRGIA